jgi:hypothetical protein
MGFIKEGVIAIITVCMCMAASLTYAWGPLGHQAICDTAWRLSDRPVRNYLEQAARRMEYKTFAEACVWADHIRSQAVYDWIKPLHYINVLRSAESVRQSSCLLSSMASPRCVIDAIRFFEQRLRDGKFSQRERDEALLLMAHFVADLHQPLHVAYEDDRGGTRKQVVFEGKLLSLHSIWDQNIIRCAYQGSWRNLGKLLYRQRKQPLSEEELTSVLLWADESLALTKIIYSNLPQALPANYCEQYYPLAEKRLALASRRLAVLLEQSLAP